MTENQQEMRRREGRTMACEGLLRSCFSRRVTQAGAKAIAKLRQAQSPNSWSWMALAAGLALLIGGSLWVSSRIYTPAYAVLDAGGQGVILNRQGKKLVASIGEQLKPGDILETTKGANAMIRFGRQSLRVTLTGAAEIKLSNPPAGTRLELFRGRIEVVASTQPPGRPLVIVTPQAEARVMGTHFFLAAKRTSTWLEVVNGWVVLRRTEDGAVSRVGPQKYAVVAPGLDIGARTEGERWQTPYCVVMKPAPRKDAS